MKLRFGLHTRPYNLPFPELQRQWRWAEDAGFDWISVFDHFYGGSHEAKLLDTYECLTAMTALAATTSRVRVGCMAACVLYRHPSLLAKMAVTIDHISGGRAEFGLGAGWLEKEFRDFGFDFPRVGVRLDHLEETVQILRTLFTGEPVTFQGTHYRLDHAVCAPVPLQKHLPLWIGGLGEKRTLRLAARHADGWNVHDVGPTLFRHKNEVLNQWCEVEGRDPASLPRSVNLGFRMGADRASAERKREEANRIFAPPRNESELVGMAPEVAERLAQYAEAGLHQVNIALPQPVDWEALQAFVEEVMPRFR